MPISPFYRPTNPQYTSQFVEEKYPDNLMFRAGLQRKKSANDVYELAQETGSEISIDADPRLSKSYSIAKQREKQYQDKIGQSIQEFSETGNIQKAKRDLLAINRAWQNDPVRLQTETQTKQFRDDMKRFYSLRQQGSPAVNYWMQDNKFVPGYTQEIGYQTPQGAGIVKGIKNEDIRNIFEEKMNVKPQTLSVDGKRIKARPKSRMFKQVGLSEQGKFTEGSVSSFNSWISDIGEKPLVDYLKRTNKINDQSTTEEINQAAQRLYIDSAQEVANRYWQHDVTQSTEGGEEEPEPLFGTEQFYETDESYNYSIPGMEKIIGTDKITQLNQEEREDITQRMAQGEIPDKIKSIMDVQSLLTQKGILDPDVQESGDFFKTEPDKYNYMKLKEYLNDVIQGIELTDVQKKDLTDLIGPKAGLGKRQTKREIRKELDPEKAQDILNDIENTEAQVYKQKLSETKPESIKGNIGLMDLSREDQTALSGLNFGNLPVIDATKGITISGDYLDRSDLQARKIVALPLQKTEEGWGKSNNRQLFLELSGRIDPQNLNSSEKQRYLAASDKEVSEGINIGAQFEDDELIYSDKLIIPINQRLADLMWRSTENKNLRDLFREYFAEQPTFESSNESENL